jgi:IS5 family transposase
VFEALFTDILNPEHELLRADHLIDWDGLHEALLIYYSPVGRHGKSVRLMVDIHILKHRYNCSDDRAVEMLHENAYWQRFCGFNTFQGGQILVSTSTVKFRNRIGTEGMKRIEAVLLHVWSEMGLVKTLRVAVDTTSQPKNIAYPTDADLLHRIKEKIVRQMQRVRKEVPLRKPFRSFGRTGKRILLGIKKFRRGNQKVRQEAIGTLKEMTGHVVKQAAGVAKTLYNPGYRECGRRLNRLVALGKRIIFQTEEVFRGSNPANCLYSLHEKDVAAIRKGKGFP